MSFSNLPNEIRLLISEQFLMLPPQADVEGNASLALAIESAKVLAEVDGHWRAMVRRWTERHFDGMPSRRPHPVRAHLTHWIPRDGGDESESVQYWYGEFGWLLPELPSIDSQLEWWQESGAERLYTFRADIRLPVDRSDHAQATATAADVRKALELLAKVPPAAPSLRLLHLNFTVHADIVRSIENILTRSHRLTEIVLVSDSPPELPYHSHPVLHLDNMLKTLDEDVSVETFIIRAPALRVSSRNPAAFFSKVQGAKVFCLAVHHLITRFRVYEWILDLLHVAPYITALEIAEAQPWDLVELRNTQLEQHKYHTLNVPFLFHLILDVYQIDRRFFSVLQAPKLKYVRIRSEGPISAFGECDINHFPNLLAVNIWCPGSVRRRFRALGLSSMQLQCGIERRLRATRDYNYEVLLYVRPYDHKLEAAFAKAKDDVGVGEEDASEEEYEEEGSEEEYDEDADEELHDDDEWEMEDVDHDDPAGTAASTYSPDMGGANIVMVQEIEEEAEEAEEEEPMEEEGSAEVEEEEAHNLEEMPVDEDDEDEEEVNALLM